MVLRTRSVRPLLATVLAGLVTFTALGLSSPGAGAVPAATPKPSPAQSRALAAKAAQDLVARRAAALHTSTGEAYTARPVLSGGGGFQYAPYVRTYKGLDVFGGDFVVNTDTDGRVVGTSVAQTRAIGNLSTTPVVTPAAAQRAVRTTIATVTRTGEPVKAIYALGTPALAWKVRVNGLHADGDREIKDVYVDARTGKVLGEDIAVHFAAGSGTAYFNGPSPLTITTTQNSSTSYSMKNPDIPNVDCRDDATGTVYTGSDNSWGDGTAASKETGCVDALYDLQTEDTMISAWLGGNGFDTQGNGWQIRVGKDEVNAFYCPPGLVETGYCDGTERVRIGHNQAGDKWLTNLDVVAHEYGHGIDQHTPGGHSGGQTSEFVADVFGALTEHYANETSTYDAPDYTVGEEVDLVGQGPIRYMYDPSKAGDPNCYSSSIPNTEVHSAAGPGNHWLYLLAEGSSPANGNPASPTCNSSTVNGIGIQKAGKIFYNAMLMKTTSSSYLKYRTWTLTAAKNLDATCGQFNAVKAAWNAVSVPAQTGDPTCTPSGGSVTVTNPGSKSGTGGTVSGTPTTAGTYNVTATATDSASQTGSTTFTFTISGTGGGCSGQKLGNPGFESGNTVWSASSGVIDNGTSQPARTGSWKAWLDGYGSSHTDTLSQSVTIPAGCSATLTFYLHIDSAETTTSTAYDKLTVKAGTTTLATYSNLNKASGYSLKSFNVSSFAGQTVSISFTGVEDSSLQTSFVIDDTAVTLS